MGSMASFMVGTTKPYDDCNRVYRVLFVFRNVL